MLWLCCTLHAHYNMSQLTISSFKKGNHWRWRWTSKHSVGVWYCQEKKKKEEEEKEAMATLRRPELSDRQIKRIHKILAPGRAKKAILGRYQGSLESGPCLRLNQCGLSKKNANGGGVYKNLCTLVVIHIIRFHHIWYCISWVYYVLCCINPYCNIML